MHKRENGFIYFAKKILSSDVFANKPDWWFKVWTFLLVSVNYEDGSLPRGSGHFTYPEILHGSHVHHVSEGALSNEIQWLKKMKQIKTRKTTRGFIITIVKYNDYQNPHYYKKDTEKDTENDREMTQKGHYIYNELNELKKDTAPLEEATMTEQETTKSSPSHKDLSFSGKNNYYILVNTFKAKYRKVVGADYADCEGDRKILKGMDKDPEKFGGFDAIFDKYLAWWKANPWQKENGFYPSIRRLKVKLNDIIQYKEVKVKEVKLDEKAMLIKTTEPKTWIEQQKEKNNVK